MTDARRCAACGTEAAQPVCPRCGHAEATGPGALVGATIDGRFRVLRLLGTGGMGAVYLAEHLGLGRRVAVKLLRAELRDHKELTSRFRREITAVSRLTDAHTITVFDSGVWQGLMYLVMEHLQGRDLAEALHDEGRLAVERAVEVASQICSSLAEAHRIGIIHRDLKPENIFLTRTASGGELVKVLDFGLAKLLDPADGPGGFETQKGTLLGTPWYMAPEQIEGGEVGPFTDLYALGTLLYRMLTGRHAFDGPSPVAILESHIRGAPPPMDAALGVPPALEAVVTRLLARRPRDRFASALAVVEALGPWHPARPAALEGASAPPRPALVVPSSFSTSAVVGPAAPVDSVPAATRDDFARFERRLVWRGRLRRGLVVLGLLAAAGAAAWYFGVRRPPPPEAEIEPNDEPRVATPLAPGVALRGFIGRRQHADRSDRDVFAVAVPAGGGTLTAEVSGVPGLDLVLELFDAEGGRLALANDAPAGGAERLTLPVGVRGEVYVVVRELWVQGVPPSENSTDAYSLVARWAP
ncbi:MAG: protein kinase [Myxococcales bacterium]|nr:protein kinase [Myxococcales bacterium]